ncbi:hypothetical protein HDU76_003804 [Blyttiomyces sp. JEL0837]|nr:hypothetical protein HDU76_003804 [Blyttiomyces sp. JEL0837]
MAVSSSIQNSVRKVEDVEESAILTRVDVLSHCESKPELIGLPTELVLKIVKHLDFLSFVKARTVCRYLHGIFFAPTFWKTIVYNRSRPGNMYSITPSIFRQGITRCGPHIRQIASTEMDVSSMELIASHCHNLVEFGLLNTSCEMFYTLLNAVSTHGGLRCFEKLRRLDIVSGMNKERGLDSALDDVGFENKLHCPHVIHPPRLPSGLELGFQRVV